MPSTRTRFLLVTAAVLSVVVVAAVAHCLLRVFADSTVSHEALGTRYASALDYPLDKQALKNPWLTIAAGDWPCMDPAYIGELARVPDPEEEKHFSQWVQGSLQERWLPLGIEEVPYLADIGFIHVKQDRDFRVRIREAKKPAYGGSSIMTKAIIMAVEPLSSGIELPANPDQFATLLRIFLNEKFGEFLQPGGMTDPAKHAMPLHFEELNGGKFLGAKPRASLPIQLYAWTDGRILLIALHEDVQYGEGTPPERNVKPTPPPPLGEE